MKRSSRVSLFIIICIVALQLASCGNGAHGTDTNDDLDNNITDDGNDTNKDTNEDEEKEDVMDGTEKNELVFTAEYDLAELRAYFESGHQNESMGGLGEEKTRLTREAVKKKYPIEIERTSTDLGIGTTVYPYYTIYKVSQGGYYYVWWNGLKNSSTGESEYCVFFSAHLTSDRSVELFDSIIPGVSTAADVKKIDPYIQFNFAFSSRTPSFSYINEETVLEIRYSWSKLDGYEDLVVEGMELREKGLASGVLYFSILPGDLP